MATRRKITGIYGAQGMNFRPLFLRLKTIIVNTLITVFFVYCNKKELLNIYPARPRFRKKNEGKKRKRSSTLAI